MEQHKKAQEQPSIPQMQGMPKMIDNVTLRLKDDLKETVTKKSKLRIAAACFSIYAFQELKAQFSQIDELRFIFTSPIAAIYRGNIP